ncbi:MAG: urate oxidase [Candidatus Nephthysia bennettiae]|uniref:factor independent urate hydroxylase n=1 Tax=Candidatus Nephthysia bennettiae TaxID=3127016 RepID=A0A934KBH0_9BACT|nr:urate oxidase [Candidatus Dormibacteraeota bacterium]MBJ7614896.1 urate oxidase [Candidatus Dormibacteraeota bacterium]PZR97076.1 MAG: urate oxidase [Candidatus Dormibacteraeota bacterium]
MAPEAPAHAARLFEDGSPLGRRLAETGPHPDPIAAARRLLGEMEEQEKLATLNGHPRIGERSEGMSAYSRDEQGTEVVPELEQLNAEYERRFGFRFVIFVDRRSRSEVAQVLRERLRRTRAEELEAALEAVIAIAEDRWKRQQVRHQIRYGKADISFYRSHATPLVVEPIPESEFTGRDNLLLAGRLTVEVLGEGFLAAYTEGDNSQVVATDTMKNFVYAQTLQYPGATAEGLVAFLAQRFLETYPQMEQLRLSYEELPYRSHSEKLLSAAPGEHSTVELSASRSGVLELESGRRDLRLVKLTGSSFASFARDRYTTLPERPDRPLHVYLDVFWTYGDLAEATSAAGSRYVAAEQVADHVRHTFDNFVSMSIQHLLHEMGHRLLARFPQLVQIRLEAENRLWDTSAESVEGPARVFSDPKPAHGSIGLTLNRGQG